LYPWRFFRALPQILWADTIVLSPSPNMLWTVLAFKGLGKKVISEHYVSYVSHSEWIPGFPDWMDRASFRSLDHIITHTEPMKEQLVRSHGLPAAGVTALYCAVDLDHFAPPPDAERQRRRREAGLDRKFVVLYHGMHHTWHGMPVILEAAKRLEDDENIRFVVLPRSGFPDRPNIVYLGEEQPFNELPRFLAIADLWISGFNPEPRGDRSFSSTMIQALAMGLPVLTSEAPEKAKHMTDGENVLFVPPNDAIALASKIRLCASDPNLRQRIGKAGRQLAERLFSFERQESRLETIFATPHRSDASKVSPSLS
jgi:glycosyltransferase involved in cell wall biosynthesis